MALSRRSFLRLASSAAVLPLVSGCPMVPAAGRGRPNVVFVLTDDQRFDSLGCMGNAMVKTPNIDSIAQAGTVFRNMFVTTSICPSSRASILTGVTETRHHYTFGTPPIRKELGLASYPSLLKKAGYHTGFIGKYGVGMQDNVEHGFLDVFDNRDRPYDARMPDGTTQHVDLINLDSALAFLRGAPAGQPFMLSLNFSSPHAEDDDKARQYHPVPWAEDLYTDTVFPPPRYNDRKYFDAMPGFLKDSINHERYLWRFDTPEKYQKSVRDYYRSVSGIDHMVGIVMDELKRSGALSNTVVIFASDNGNYLGDRQFADKFTHYEESMRVPLVIADFRAPRSEAAQAETMALNVDIPATILDVAGIPIPTHYQGRSLVPALAGHTPSDWRTDFFCQETFNAPSIPKWVGVHGQRYVYARYYEQQPVYEFLFDLEGDPSEIRNLAEDSSASEQLLSMRNRCDELQRTTA